MIDNGRPAIDLDGEWRFVADPERLYNAAELPAGEPIGVPGCWEAQVPRPYRIITAWYHRRFDVPADWAGSRLLIRFGAVMYRCAVWLNGRQLATHEGGYTAFTVDAGDAARFGAENELAVEVQNPLNAIAEYPALAVERVLSAEQYAPDLPLSEAPHGKQTWYSSQSGIWQSVRAERVGRVGLASLLVLPDLAGESASVRWRRDGDLEAPARLKITIRDPSGREVSRSAADVAPGDERGELRAAVPDPVPWGIGTPNLYTVEAVVSTDDGEQDRLRDRFGMREIATRDGAVTLNGEPIYLLGALDQDLYPDTISTPPSREFLDEQLRRARELGFNLLRCHIKAPDPAYLDAADEAGMLVWCELPNWTRFTVESAARGVATLEQMVETLGNHPSLAIWTIINEDWGTRLRYEKRDREWLKHTYDWLKQLDPTRLVVDNSACETTETPNFHLKSDLADFHVYFGPDNFVRWQHMIRDYARRPSWLWSPHGDAEPRGDEPLVLSEFGGWGLPQLGPMVEHYGAEPWWFGTGQGYYRPSGLRRRFVRYGLDRLWSDVDHLAWATQWAQFHSLHLQIGEMRRQASITGYVVTELSDAYWEANGLLDVARRPKAYHDRLREINAPDVVMFLPEHHDLWGGQSLVGDLFVSSFATAADGAGERPGGRVEWRLRTGEDIREGVIQLDAWPDHDVHSLGRVELPVGDVSAPTDACLELAAYDGSGRLRARDELPLAVLPRSGVEGRAAANVAVHDPLDIWGIADRMRQLGHRLTSRADADVVIASQLTPQLVAHAERGGRVLVLVRASSAVASELELHRRVTPHLRRLPHAGWPGQRSPWEGDWVSNYNWILPGTFPRLPYRAPLDVAYREVAPDHVLLGYDPVRHREEVSAGMFVGWIHEPAALLWSFEQGRGSITLTTFRLAPEHGPVAATMLECLVEQLAAGEPIVAGTAIGGVR